MIRIDQAGGPVNLVSEHEKKPMSENSASDPSNAMGLRVILRALDYRN